MASGFKLESSRNVLTCTRLIAGKNVGGPETFGMEETGPVIHGYFRLKTAPKLLIKPHYERLAILRIDGFQNRV